MRLTSVVVGIFVLLLAAGFFADNPGPQPAEAGGGSGFLWGDIDCDGGVDVIDSLALERYIAGLSVPPPAISDPCFDLGTVIDAEGAAGLTWGNVTCVGGVDVLDSLALKRFVAGLSVPPPAIGDGCLDIGEVFGEVPEELPPLTVDIDGAIVVPPDIPGVDGEGPARPLSVLEDEDGNRTVFVQDELVLVTNNMGAVDAFLARWNGTLVKTLKPGDYDIDVPEIHLVRIDPSGADTSSIQADLRQINANAWGDFSASSEEARELLAVAADEAAGGLPVDLNWVMQSSDYDQRDIRESPTGPGGWNPNPFTWTYMNRGSAQDIGVADAWRALAASDKLGNKVKISILDGGFAPNADFPAGYTSYGGTGIVNPATCTAGSSCPWHGTMVTAAAMGVPGNNFGVAGPAGPIADAVITQSPSSDVLSYIQYILFHIPATAFEAPDVVNISAGAGIASEWCLTGICSAMDGVILGLRKLDILVLAAAGNEGKNVDAEKCFDPPFIDPICYERTVWIPCEIFDVICVGGLGDNTNARHPNSNYGAGDSATVDIYGPYVQYKTPAPDSPGVTFGPCGTSCATPFVSGVAALIKAADPSLDADDLEAFLMETAHTNSIDSRVPRWVNAYEAVTRALGNKPPELSIDQLGGTGFGGLPLEFSAQVSDPEDRPTLGHPYTGQPAVQWTSDRDGPFGTGVLLTDVMLSYGAHQITAVATDTSGARIRDSINLNLVNDPPVVTIVTPADNKTFYEGQNVKLLATSRDRNYASGRLDDADITWYLTPLGNPGDRTNPLGDGHEITVQLTEGAYNIVVVGTDDQSASATDIAVNIQVGPTPADLPPEAFIDNLDDTNACQAPIYEFTFTGHATDAEDGNLTGNSLVWTLNGSVVLGTGVTITVPTNQIPVGANTITLTATDSNNGVGEDTEPLQFDGCIVRAGGRTTAALPRLWGLLRLR